jgi:hypothetical protein
MPFKWRYVIAALVVAIGVPGGYFAWWLGSPLLFDDTVDEAFPFAVQPTPSPDGDPNGDSGTLLEIPDLALTATGSESAAFELGPDTPGDPDDIAVVKEGTGTATPTPASLTPDPEDVFVVKEGTPTPAPVSDDATPTPSPPGSDATATPTPRVPTPSTPTPLPAIPDDSAPDPTPTLFPGTPVPEQEAESVTVALSTGEFADADNFHKGSGTATVYRGPDGSLLLRLEDFTVTNGPDLHVYVTPHLNPGNSSQVKADGHLDLGELKGNVGNQNYFLPDDFDLGLLGAVVIYCQPFNIIFSVAPLTGS